VGYRQTIEQHCGNLAYRRPQAVELLDPLRFPRTIECARPVAPAQLSDVVLISQFVGVVVFGPGIAESLIDVVDETGPPPSHLGGAKVQCDCVRNAQPVVLMLPPL
jgi:hypothetical protein